MENGRDFGPSSLCDVTTLDYFWSMNVRLKVFAEKTATTEDGKPYIRRVIDEIRYVLFVKGVAK